MRKDGIASEARVKKAFQELLFRNTGKYLPRAGSEAIVRVSRKTYKRLSVVQS